MKTTFGFNENNNNDGAVISPYIPQISTKEAKLRIATNGMPDIIPSDTVVYDVKTQQLYVGNGKGLDPALFSNIHVIENKAALPKEAVRNNLYITLEEGIITVYDPVSKAWKQIQGGGEGGVIEKQIQVYSSKNDFPKRGTEDKLYIAKDTMYGYVYDTDTDKYISLVKDSYTKAEIDSKIAKIQTTKGDKGDQGENGKSAYELAKEEGYTGTQKQWLDSLNGTAGKSAYQIAKDNGFVGDETKWLKSLKGERGATGAAGAPGEQGPRGEPGQNGADADMSNIYTKAEIDEKISQLEQYAFDDYEDIFHIPESETRSEFKLTYKPIGQIRIYIDGIRYFSDTISYDENTNTVTWINTAEKAEGFNITDADVVFEYDYDRRRNNK